MELKGYTIIPDWMLSLDLDVYETIILAVIYGFSQDGESTFSGSQTYLARKAKCTKRKVAMVLPKLVERGIIIKIDRDVRGLHLCEYKIAPPFMGDEYHSPGDEYYSSGGDECHSSNNIENKKIDNNKKLSIECATRFQKPTIDDIREYCFERGNTIDPILFFDHYESNGWMVGKSKMKDWKAAIRTWEQRETGDAPQRRSQKKESVLEHNLRVMDQMYGTSMHAQAYGKRGGQADEQ